MLVSLQTKAKKTVQLTLDFEQINTGGFKAGFHYRHSPLDGRLPGTTKWAQHYCFSQSPEKWCLLPEGKTVCGTATIAEGAGEAASLSSSPCLPYISGALENNGRSKSVLQSCALSG